MNFLNFSKYLAVVNFDPFDDTTTPSWEKMVRFIYLQQIELSVKLYFKNSQILTHNMSLSPNWGKMGPSLYFFNINRFMMSHLPQKIGGIFHLILKMVDFSKSYWDNWWQVCHETMVLCTIIIKNSSVLFCSQYAMQTVNSWWLISGKQGVRVMGDYLQEPPLGNTQI